jgi:uncharacterized membrane protein YeiH
MNLDVTTFVFPVVLDIIATIAWATSGAIVARARRFDIMGVLFIAVIASTGGGLIRDGLFLNRTPVMVTTPYYLAVAVICAFVVTLFGSQLERIEVWPLIVNSIDALGTPAFAILGFQLSIIAGMPFLGALFVGLLNGTSGGILRDVLVGDTPQLFRPGQLFGLIVIGSMVLYAGLLTTGRLSSDVAAWLAIGAAMVGRLLVIRFNWQTRPASDFRVDEVIKQVPDLSRWPQWARNSRKPPRDSDHTP